jgi:3'(2'), 5'-bisphosphate nucleotidase
VGLARPVPVTVSPDALVRLAHLAVAAGHATLQHYRPGGEAAPPVERSPAAAADRVSHTIIVEGLHHWDPTVPILSGAGAIPTPSERAGWQRFWLVDPLDGSEEFVRQNGEFTVNIALIEQGEPVLGAIYAPALDLLYYAARGLGSWKRRGTGAPERIRSRPPASGQRLRLAESRSHASPELETLLGTRPVAERIPAGSSLKFCWVAEGRADVCARLGPTMEWEVAAGDCIFRNSGADRTRVSELVYNQPELRSRGFVIGLADGAV